MTIEVKPVPSDTLARPVLVSSAGLVVAIMIVNAVNYGLNVLLANLVTPALFGDISLMVTILLITGVLASTLQLATSVSLLGADSEPGDQARRLSTMRLLANRLGLGGGLALALASPFAADLLQIEDTWSLVIMAIGFPAHLQLAVERGRLQGQMALGRMASTFLGEGATRFLATLVALAVFPHLLTLTIALNLGFLGAYVLCRPKVGVWAWCDLSSPSGHPPVRSVGIAVVAATLLMNLDLVVAKAVFEPADAGSFAALALGGRIVFFASWTLQQALLPLVSAKSSVHPMGAQAGQRLFLAANGIVCGVLVAGAWLWADTWVSVGFGEHFEGIAPLFGPYAFGTALIAMLSAYALICSTRGDDRHGVALVCGSVVLISVLFAMGGSLGQFVATRQVVLVGFVAVGAMVSQFPNRSSQRTAGRCRRVL